MLQHPILTKILLVALSLLISAFGSIVGFGGGIFMVPVLLAVFHFPLHYAVGAAMICLVPSTLISTYSNRKNGFVDFKMGTLLEIPTVVGVLLGSFLLSYVSPGSLKIVFSIVIFILGLTFFTKKRKTDNRSDANKGLMYRLNGLKPRFVVKNSRHHVVYRASLWMLMFFGLMSGALAGLFGIGGGFMKTPIMIKVFKIPAKIAAATSLFMIVITSIVGSVSHYAQGHIRMDLAWPLMLGFAAGAVCGQYINVKIKNNTLEFMIGIALMIAASLMLYNIWASGGQ